MVRLILLTLIKGKKVESFVVALCDKAVYKYKKFKIIKSNQQVIYYKSSKYNCPYNLS